MNRRRFLGSLAALGAASSLRPSLISATVGAGRKPRVGLVGCGWYGGVVLDAIATSSDVSIVSLCDPDQRALDKTRQAVLGFGQPEPRLHVDYREMLEPGAHDIVIVSTPDHWHTLPAITAMQAGADVLLEKPISVDVIEGEALVAAARKHQRVVQVNLQRRSTRCLAEARDKYLKSGRIGRIGLVETFSHLPGRPPGVIKETPPPAELNWDLWTGPAPMLPFRLSGDMKSWRAFMEYGNGQIGDLGVHMLDTVRWMLNLGWPSVISSTGGIYVDRDSTSTISDTQHSLFRYPELELTWQHRTWGAPSTPPKHWTDQWGARVLGSGGTLTLSIVGYEFTPADGGPKEGFSLLSTSGDLENIDADRLGPELEVVQKDHVANFMRAREARSRPIADIEEGHISSACCILANVAQELGRPLRYDPITRTVRDDEEATSRLARPYRAPWQHPDPAHV